MDTSYHKVETGAETEALKLMREASLPSYIVNCFLAAGYAVIGDMDVTDSPGNTIKVVGIQNTLMIHYIAAVVVHGLVDPKRRDMKCKIPPGHRQKMKKFRQCHARMHARTHAHTHAHWTRK